MSGHSKWHTIKHKKAAIDAKRGKIFTRLIKEIVIAARNGGDPDANARLRTAIIAAKSMSMPADNIKRAVMRGTGELEGATIEEYTYEGYGPGGAAILVNVATDNKNRTVSEVRHAFGKYGGNMGDPGSVSYMFERKSQIVLEKDKGTEDQLMGIILDAGGDDLLDEADTWTILSAPEAHEAMVNALAGAKVPSMSAEVAMVPKNTMNVDTKHLGNMMKLLEFFEDHDDVQSVFSNFEPDAEQLESLG